MFVQDTIIAPATPPGEGGIGIIRISGPLSEGLLLKHFSPSAKPTSLNSHHLYHGFVRDPQGTVVDEVLAVIMRTPKSFTREDVVEIHCHGGPVILARILDLFISDGARLAQPGEFTLRAFLNGRIDLTRAEAVIDLIRSRSEGSARIAASQLEGKLSQALFKFKQVIADTLSLIEAYVDFPEEEIGNISVSLIEKNITGLLSDIETLLDSFESGRVLREGISVLILGRPNVGKSSLLNALLGEARAIVTDLAGTTRDTIEENLVLEGIPLRLVDTAGIRSTLDPIEAEGVKRAQSKISSSDLVLLVVDGHSGINDDDLLAFQATESVNRILVINKCDLDLSPLPAPFDELDSVFVSVRTGEGLDQLKKHIRSIFFNPSLLGDTRETIVLSDRRHKEALFRVRSSLGRFLLGITENSPYEFLALDLHDALNHLGEITGETTPDDILDNIFNKFCIGK